MKKKVLLIRLDKIGDLICTLPADQIIDNAHYEITWVLQKGMGAVADLGVKKRNYFELDQADQKGSAEKLAQLLQQFKPDIAISFQAPWWVHFELFKAGVPNRTGVRSQWHSFLFLNRAIRQKRSQAEKHEFDYNLELVRKALDLKQTKQFIYFEIAQPTDLSALTKHGLTAKDYIVVHPGMSGSALNWSQKQYIEYITQQIQLGKKIVVTGTDSDESYVNEIRAAVGTNPFVNWLQSKLHLNELVQVLSQAKFVVAPSTGVAHIAASLGIKVHAIYSPVRVHQPRRWAARGPQVQIHAPQVDCPGVHNCIGESCKYFFCMEKLRI